MLLDLPLDVFFAVFLGLGVFVLFALWIYYESRRRPSDSGRDKVLYHCVRCGCLYSGKSDESKKACPSCGYQNIRLRF